MNGILRFVVDVIFIFICAMWTYVNIQETRRLNAREAKLERYAGDLDSWDTTLKTREVQITGIIRRDERLKTMRDK